MNDLEVLKELREAKPAFMRDNHGLRGPPEPASAQMIPGLDGGMGRMQVHPHRTTVVTRRARDGETGPTGPTGPANTTTGPTGPNTGPPTGPTGPTGTNTLGPTGPTGPTGVPGIGSATQNVSYLDHSSTPNNITVVIP